jgi:hypothetical protein
MPGFEDVVDGDTGIEPSFAERAQALWTKRIEGQDD